MGAAGVALTDRQAWAAPAQLPTGHHVSPDRPGASPCLPRQRPRHRHSAGQVPPRL